MAITQFNNTSTMVACWTGGHLVRLPSCLLNVPPSMYHLYTCPPDHLTTCTHDHLTT